MYSEILKKYFPESSLNYLDTILKENKFQLRFVKGRSRRLGDFRAKRLFEKYHIITINNNLDKELTLTIFLHEYAHLLKFNKYGRKGSPHGIEWKTIYKSLLNETIKLGFFSEDFVQKELKDHLIKTKATISLKKDVLDLEKKNLSLLKNIEPSSKFMVDGHKTFIFQIVQKQRTRYSCKNLVNGKMYLIRENTAVKIIE